MHKGRLIEFQTELSLFGDEKSREGIKELSTVFTLHFYHCKTKKRNDSLKRNLKNSARAESYFGRNKTFFGVCL